MEKRGQVAIFVIIAIVIVVAGILLYLFVPGISVGVSGELTPSTFLKPRLELDIQENMEILSKQGGYANPEGSIMYQGNDVKYLCYNAQYYLPCHVQQPLIKAKFERELEDMITAKTQAHVAELKKEYEDRGYSVSQTGNVETSVEIAPNRIRVSVSAPMTVSKDGTERFDEFRFNYPSKMYDLLLISTSIVDYESTYGDSETTLYTQYYPNLVIEKNKLGDGSTIYTVSDATTEDSFTFASRSVAWPGGLGLEA